MTQLADALDRTLLLMRDECGPDIADVVLIQALTSTRIALIADAANIVSHAAQTAFVTAAQLMARSGHQVFLMAPDLPLVAAQPPLGSGGVIEQLELLGKDLLPRIEFMVGSPTGEIDLAIALGDSPMTVRARRYIRLNAENWSGIIMPAGQPVPWTTQLWPFGGLATGGLGAGEAFKMAML